MEETKQYEELPFLRIKDKKGRIISQTDERIEVENVLGKKETHFKIGDEFVPGRTREEARFSRLMRIKKKDRDELMVNLATGQIDITTFMALTGLCYEGIKEFCIRFLPVEAVFNENLRIPLSDIIGAVKNNKEWIMQTYGQNQGKEQERIMKFFRLLQTQEWR